MNLGSLHRWDPLIYRLLYQRVAKAITSVPGGHRFDNAYIIGFVDSTEKSVFRDLGDQSAEQW